jgi:RNA polymerase sigma factor (sigma-70 family)
MTADVQDRLTFTGFFECTFPGMLARAIMLCGHRQDAEDAVQEAYLQALQRWDRLSGYDSAEAWVYKVMTQRLSKERRRRARARTQDLPPGDIPVPLEAGPEQQAEMREVFRLLGDLTRPQRAALLLHCLQGMSQEEVARELGVRRGTVAATIFQARRKLADGLRIPLDGLSGSEEALMAAPGLTSPIVAWPGGDSLAPILARVEAGVRAAIEADHAQTGQRMLAEILAEAGPEDQTDQAQADQAQADQAQADQAQADQAGEGGS